MSDGRFKNDNYKQDPEWQKQRAIYIDPPGEFAANQLMARMRAVFKMEEIELRISC